ncbi:DMT family transporter [archaeon]
MNKLKGFAAIIGSALAFGFSTIVVKLAMNEGLDPFAFSVVSMFFVAAFLLPYYATLKKPRLTKKDWRDFVLLGVSASGLAHLAYTFALNYTSAINFSFLSQTVPLFTIMFAFFMLGERLKKWHIVAGAVMLAGVFLVSTGGEQMALQLGDMLLIGGAIVLGFTNVVAKKLMKRHSAGVIAFWRAVFGAASLLVVALLLGVDLFPVIGAYSAASGFLVAVIFMCVYISLRELGASLASLLFLVAPLFSVVLAVVILGEALLFMQVIGGILILLGALLIYRS